MLHTQCNWKQISSVAGGFSSQSDGAQTCWTMCRIENRYVKLHNKSAKGFAGVTLTAILQMYRGISHDIITSTALQGEEGLTGTALCTAGSPMHEYLQKQTAKVHWLIWSTGEHSSFYMWPFILSSITSLILKVKVISGHYFPQPQVCLRERGWHATNRLEPIPLRSGSLLPGEPQHAFYLSIIIYMRISLKCCMCCINSLHSHFDLLFLSYGGLESALQFRWSWITGLEDRWMDGFFFLCVQSMCCQND